MTPRKKPRSKCRHPCPQPHENSREQRTQPTLVQIPNDRGHGVEATGLRNDTAPDVGKRGVRKCSPTRQQPSQWPEASQPWRHLSLGSQPPLATGGLVLGSTPLNSGPWAYRASQTIHPIDIPISQRGKQAQLVAARARVWTQLLWQAGHSYEVADMAGRH